jgi:hypothetical protein
VQEPMYTAAQEQFGNNPFAQLFTGNGGNDNIFTIIDLLVFFL